MTGADIFVGLDLGTSGLKGVALDASGAVVARASAAYPTHRPAPGACEQAPRPRRSPGSSAPPRRPGGGGVSACPR